VAREGTRPTRVETAVARCLSTARRPESFWELCTEGDVFRTPRGQETNVKRDATKEEAVDVLVVGGGFQGLWLSHFLRKHLSQGAGSRERTMMVVERDRLSFGASSRNAGFLTAGNITEILDDCNEIGEENAFEIFKRRAEGIHLITSSFPQIVESCTEFGSCDFDDLTEEKISVLHRINDFISKQAVSSPALRALGSDAPFSPTQVHFCGTKRPISINSFDKGINPVRLLMMLRSDLEQSASQPPLLSSFAFGWNVDSVSDGKAVLSRPSPSDPSQIV